MPQLTTLQTEQLHTSLLALRDELTTLLQDSADGARPVALDQPIGRLSRMDALQQQSMAQANRRSAQLRLERVLAALQRLSQDEFGECIDCGEQIGFARLKARPESPFCIDCQGQREKR